MLSGRRQRVLSRKAVQMMVELHKKLNKSVCNLKETHALVHTVTDAICHATCNIVQDFPQGR